MPNDDDHGRNHAFLMAADGQWSLAPAFDLTLAAYPLASGFRAGRINGKSRDIGFADLARLGSEHDIRRPAEIIRHVAAAVADWETHAKNRGVSRSNIAMVAEQHRLRR